MILKNFSFFYISRSFISAAFIVSRSSLQQPTKGHPVPTSMSISCSNIKSHQGLCYIGSAFIQRHLKTTLEFISCNRAAQCRWHACPTRGAASTDTRIIYTLQGQGQKAPVTHKTSTNIQSWCSSFGLCINVFLLDLYKCLLCHMQTLSLSYADIIFVIC